MQINWETVGVIVTVMTTVMGVILWVSSKIFKWGTLSQRLTNVETDVIDVKKTVNEARADLTKRIDDLMIAVAQKSLTESNSPRQLSDDGKKVLEDSGIQQLVESKFDKIVEQVKSKAPSNAYQVEREVIESVKSLADDPDLKDKLEQGAFNSGQTVYATLFVAAIYIRDKVLESLGMKPEEIDKHDPAV